MKDVVNLVVLVTLGAVLSVPLLMLVQAAGGVFSFLRLMMMATCVLGGAGFAFASTRKTKSKGKRAGLVVIGGLVGLLIGLVGASVSESEHESQCTEAHGATRVMMECDGPIGGSN
ncbi:TPA: hypothetical protein ACGHF9_004192 [Salmonella enterica subsp. enterica serovar Potsdam]|nr:hypothetical protein [Salmonella enterica]